MSRRSGAVLAVLIAATACTPRDARLAADTQAEERWSDVESTLELRRSLSHELSTEVQRRGAVRESEPLRSASAEFDDARVRVASMPMARADLSDPAKVAAWSVAQARLQRARSRLAEVLDLEAFLIRLRDADARFHDALGRYDDAVRIYDVALSNARGDDMNPMTGDAFEFRAYFEAIPRPSP